MDYPEVNGQHRLTQDEEKLNTICVGHPYTQTSLNNVNKT